MAATIVVSMWVWLQNACGQLGLQGKQLPGGGLLQNTTPYFFVFGCLILPPKPLVVKGLGQGVPSKTGAFYKPVFAETQYPRLFGGFPIWDETGGWGAS